MNRIRINPGDSIPIFLEEKEWRLIVNESPISNELIQKLRSAQSKKEGRTIHLTLDDMDELIEVAAQKMENDPDEYKRKVWINLFARLRSMLDTYTDGDNEIWDDEEVLWDDIQEELNQFPNLQITNFLPVEIRNRIDEIMSKKGVHNLEEFNAVLEEAQRGYNQAPQSDLGDLSPEQVYGLIYTPWDAPQCPMRINPNPPCDRIKSLVILQNARIFLHYLLEEGGKTKATSAKNLNRQFVGRLMERLIIPPKEIDIIRNVCKVINESDVMPLHMSRILLDMAGALRIRKNVFYITSQGKKWLKESDEALQSLYATLFITYFQKLNLSYLDRHTDNPDLQSTISYSFYQLSKLARTWRETPELAYQIVLPSVIENTPVNPYYDLLLEQIFRRILKPLAEFGLLEIQPNPEIEFQRAENTRIRKTSLFDSFLKFSWE